MGGNSQYSKNNEVILYSRVSDYRDINQSADNQIKALKRWSKKYNLNIIDTFVDKCSGKNIYKQPQLMKLVRNKFLNNKTIIITYIDRLSRDANNTLKIIKELRKRK